MQNKSSYSAKPTNQQGFCNAAWAAHHFICQLGNDSQQICHSERAQPNSVEQQTAVAGFTITPDLPAKHGLALYKAGIEPLPTVSNVKAEQVIIVKRELANKVRSMGWFLGVQRISTRLNQDDCTINLISEYVQIDHQTRKAESEEFLKESGLNGQQYAAQNIN